MPNLGGFRLRSRESLDVPSAERALGSARRRRAAPACWAWAWPLASDEAPLPPPPTPNSSWLADVRAAAVADDGSALALVSRAGNAVLAFRAAAEPSAASGAGAGEEDGAGEDGGLRLVKLVMQTSKLHDCDADSSMLFACATSVALFHVADPVSSAIDLVVAVGYESGAVAFFDASSGSACAASRPVAGQPVRRLRFVPAFHLHDPVSAPDATSQYPYPTQNAGLFCVFGWSGLVGRLPMVALVDAIASRRFDPKGAGWILWRLQTQDAVVDAVPCSSEPNAVFEMDPAPENASLRVIAGGINPAISAFSCGSSSAFSARDVARKAATAVLSAAKGAVVSRLSSFVPRFSSAPPANVSIGESTGATGAVGDARGLGDDDEDTGKAALSAVVRASISWSDEPESSSPLLRFGLQDVSDTARKSVANILARRHARMMATAQTVGPAENGASSSSSAHPVSNTVIESPGSPGTGALPQNTRLVQRCVVSPLPSSLFATSDTLGRVFILDARDLCVIRMLKGYRDAHVAWLARGGPILVVLAPRRSIIELHSPLVPKRLTAFEVEPGSLLLQSTSFAVFSLSPSGILYELSPARKTAEASGRNTSGPSRAGESSREAMRVAARKGRANGVEGGEESNHSVDEGSVSPQPPSNATVSDFVDCCRSGHTNQAIEILDLAAVEDLQRMAHLMAHLVCTSSFIRSEVHVALASRAGRLALDSGNRDLELRYEAHGRLAEAFGLLAVEGFPGVLESSAAEVVALGSDEAFSSCLHQFDDPPSGKRGGNRSNEADSELVSCERFILAHVVLPSIPSHERTSAEYLLRPRDDLSEPERVWLARAYFGRLVAVDENDVSRRTDLEPSSSRDVFLALGGVLGFSVEELVAHFIDFFLWFPVVDLLKTPLSLHQSGLRFALNRLRSRADRAIVDDNIIHACENTTRIANAMLLVRLCVVHEGAGSASVDPRYLTLQDQLIQAVRLRADLVGSKAEAAVRGRITARHFQGSGGEAERQAVSLLAEGGEDVHAAAVLSQLASKRPRLEWHEAASVSEVALAIARKRMADMFDEEAYASIAPNVAVWIREGREEKSGLVPVMTGDSPRPASTARRAGELEGIQKLLIAAHEHFPDTSIDTVRCLQLAEAINSLLRLYTIEGEGVTDAPAKIDTDHVAEGEEPNAED